MNKNQTDFLNLSGQIITLALLLAGVLHLAAIRQDLSDRPEEIKILRQERSNLVTSATAATGLASAMRMDYEAVVQELQRARAELQKATVEIGRLSRELADKKKEGAE